MPPVRVLEIDPVGLVTPGSCACCLEPASSSRAERGIIVPYCDACQRHASAVTTRQLAAGSASAIVAAVLSLSLPLALPWAGLAPLLLIVVLASLLPIAPLLLPRRAHPGHSAAGRAVWWTRRGELACTNPRWASELGEAHLAELREPRVSRPIFAGTAIAIVALPLMHRLHHPLVRVLNLTEARLALSADGRLVASIDPTSAESAAAGVELRLPSGRRNLLAVDPEGRTIADVEVRLESGGRHLFAPGSDGICFWLERTGYGRSGEPTAERTPLKSAERFWVLPPRLDTWFAPNPEPPSRDRRSSGGELLALRQAPCSVAPPDALTR
jgi:hypothetical protein